MGLPLLNPYLQSIGSDFRHGANFATLASTALLPNTSVFVTGISPFSLAIQLNQMEFRDRVVSSNGNNAGQLPSPDIFGHALYTIDIGQNDFTSNLGSLGVEKVKQNLPSVVNQISWTIQDLYNIGARNSWCSTWRPSDATRHSSRSFHIAAMTWMNLDASKPTMTEFYYNELLKISLPEVRKKLQDASIVYVNKHTVTLELFGHPDAHGLKYGTKAYCGYGGGVYNFNQNVYCGNSKAVNGQTVTTAACGDPHNYVSWNGIHATEAANKIIASAVISGSYSYPPSKLYSP
ncbi:GDSL esterase/lipase [Dichanthelium oligosanthes]|uniref:GDSL esterase/lipase n=1 Tax=Dichanthelium oligosanthes TaxID=888268 RepID=A0A1E5W7W1_9POAL|nr:GDSL esterase/lipase [Dichanthelium oligosanthes]